MEMHQVRYFLALSETLNFTQAATRCNVTQPALTRAIRSLEIELGGELLRRERGLSHLTELGERMLPLMRQCFESALAVQTVAHSMKKGESTPLSIAISLTIGLTHVTPILRELSRLFTGVQLKVLRGSGEEVVDWLKNGEAELAIAGPLAMAWSRLDAFALYEEPYDLFLSRRHKFAGETADRDQLAQETLLVDTRCEMAAALADRLNAMGLADMRRHQLASQSDVLALLEANFGVAILPVGSAQADGVRRVALLGLELTRTVSVYCVAGRRRSSAGATLLNMLRAADWPAHQESAHDRRPPYGAARA
jgi:DNA-binding transcriptional LysR family regulator